MKILVTGFEPFNNEMINPALEAVMQLPEIILDARIIKLTLPTVFQHSTLVLKKAMHRYQPDVVLNIGQAGGRFDVSVERIAININDARIADNEGHQPLDEIIHKSGPAAYFSQLPIKAIVKAIREAGIPAVISNSAGTFVCNHVMYQVQHLIATDFPAVKGGFIHVPYLPEQVVGKERTPSMSLENIVLSLIIAIRTIIQFHNKKDIKAIEGTLH